MVQPIVELSPGSVARSFFTAGGRTLGQVRFGAVGAQGNALSPTELLPIGLSAAAPGAAVTVTMTTCGGTGRVDALLVIPLVSSLLTAGGGHATLLLSSVSAVTRAHGVQLPGTGPVTVRSYDRNGGLVRSSTGKDGVVAIVSPGGFTVATR